MIITPIKTAIINLIYMDYQNTNPQITNKYESHS